ncbi:permease [Halobacillus litoralis]|uniref:permease n=1 Tax=Halobacillus litoralis TaxID=45668 RepID=UPI001CD3A6E8|nr:permease [Halobacillus litoralis]MCA0970565.1 permease [Halobacillus litoralis]
MNNTSASISKISYLVLIGFLALFLFADFFSMDWLDIPSSLLDMNTMWISIVLEAIPFVLLGVFISSVIQIFIKEETLKRFIPKNPALALVPAVTIGAIFPVCECAIVPIVRRLLQKGMPLHVGIVILVSAPVLNPIVFLSTFYAFQTDTSIAWARMGLAFFASLMIGALIYRVYGNRNVLHASHTAHSHNHHDDGGNKIAQVFQHASDEFFDMGKFLIIGALVASAVQTFVAREALVNIGTGALAGPAVMMGLAYILSLCSEADAFVASSFKGLFSSSSILAFLVYGPMTDLKNTILMLAYFKKRFVLGFLIVVTITVYVITLVYQTFIL